MCAALFAEDWCVDYHHLPDKTSIRASWSGRGVVFDGLSVGEWLFIKNLSPHVWRFRIGETVFHVNVRDNTEKDVAVIFGDNLK